MLTVEEINDGLKHFYGSDCIYRYGFFRSVVITEGVKWFAENTECFWLLDIIASYQHKIMMWRWRRNSKTPRNEQEMLLDFQLWVVEKNKKSGKFEVYCKADTGDNPETEQPYTKAISQKIKYSNFPLDEFKFYVKTTRDGNRKLRITILLPSEH